MVARGDLGVEIGDAELVGVQKKINCAFQTVKPCCHYSDTNDGIND